MAVRSRSTIASLALAFVLGIAPAASAAPPAAAQPHDAHAQQQHAGPQVHEGPHAHDEAARGMGRNVMIATGSAGPSNLIPALRKHALRRDGRTNVHYMSTFASDENFRPEVTDKFHPNLFFASKPNRDNATRALAGDTQAATLHHASLFKLSKRIESGKIPLDTVVVRVSPPDEEGNVSLGTASDLTMVAVKAVLARGGKIIAEVNPNVPHMQGNRIPYNSLSHVVHENELLPEGIQIAPMAAETKLAQHVAGLMPKEQRHTLQVGIGDALAGIGDALKDHPVDIWSEMGPPGLLKLTNAPDSKVGTAHFSFMHGDNDAYRASANNPRITMGTSKEINDPKVIATKPRMVAINTALEVDLFGNTNAERDGNRVISFPGGQPDFMKGAAMAPDGKAVMALRSTAKNAVSTITLGLKGPTTTPKNHVDHVVTEWGATKRMRGLSDGARAFEIIQVAHPAFRSQLADEAKTRGLITAAQVGKIKGDIFGAIHNAPTEMRQAAADLALEKGAITNDQHTQIVVEMLEPKIGGFNN